MYISKKIDAVKSKQKDAVDLLKIMTTVELDIYIDEASTKQLKSVIRLLLTDKLGK